MHEVVCTSYLLPCAPPMPHVHHYICCVLCACTLTACLSTGPQRVAEVAPDSTVVLTPAAALTVSSAPSLRGVLEPEALISADVGLGDGWQLDGTLGVQAMHQKVGAEVGVTRQLPDFHTPVAWGAGVGVRPGFLGGIKGADAYAHGFAVGQLPLLGRWTYLPSLGLAAHRMRARHTDEARFALNADVGLGLRWMTTHLGLHLEGRAGLSTLSTTQRALTPLYQVSLGPVLRLGGP